MLLGDGGVHLPLVGNIGSQVTSLIGRQIVSGELRPGQTLPTEAELCEKYGVSRTTIREALKKLHGKGLIVGTSRAGTRVLPTDKWNQFDADVLKWSLDGGVSRSFFQELYSIRVCFEPESCRVAALNARDDDHQRIMKAFEDMTALRTQPSKLIDADLDFHMAIVDATHNRFFICLGHAIRTALWLSFSLLQSRSDMPESELIIHGRIADSIVAGRGDEASEMMRELIAISARNIADIQGRAADATSSGPIRGRRRARR